MHTSQITITGGGDGMEIPPQRQTPPTQITTTNRRVEGGMKIRTGGGFQTHNLHKSGISRIESEIPGAARSTVVAVVAVVEGEHTAAETTADLAAGGVEGDMTMIDIGEIIGVGETIMAHSGI
eukprot:comp23022_c3_seq1/m.36762 comp23022_c3_seq1/g.36762  ORF comp23022_c3_seq1/g.36762 comp23022_c3_seq1/m.36762 type:complete len:123 (-) comp23022_c3_seq1:567-935(-)